MTSCRCIMSRLNNISEIQNAVEKNHCYRQWSMYILYIMCDIFHCNAIEYFRIPIRVKSHIELRIYWQIQKYKRKILTFDHQPKDWTRNSSAEFILYIRYKIFDGFLNNMSSMHRRVDTCRSYNIVYYIITVVGIIK